MSGRPPREGLRERMACAELGAVVMRRPENFAWYRSFTGPAA
jgi:hypothetical protein